MQNITELRKSLSENYSQMKDRSMSIKLGKELANTAGKIITSLNTELQYNSMMDYKNKIEFLEPIEKID